MYFEYQDGEKHLIPLETRVIPASLLGLSTLRQTRILEAQKQLLVVAFSVMSTFKGRMLIESLLHPNDKTLLDFERFDSNLSLYADNGYLTKASITRVDYLHGRFDIRACDLNLIPLGIAYTHAYTQAFLNEIPSLSGDLNEYELALKQIMGDTRDKISGVVTNVNYPGFRSHLYMTNVMRNKYGLPMYVIPPEAVNTTTGQVELSNVKKLYERLEIDLDPLPQNGSTGTLILYSRELGTIKNPGITVINRPGTRVLESQLFGTLICLDGFESYYKKLTGKVVNRSLHLGEYIPSTLIQLTPEFPN